MREAEVLLSETHMSCDAVVEDHWRGGPGCVVKGSEMKSVGTHVADGSPSISVYRCI